jgi:DNA-binding response OmpR family regulator
MHTILIIDDDAQVREMLKKMFGRVGYHVLTAKDGKEGLRLFETSSVDLVVTDLIMPEQEGIETIIALRRRKSDVKIIAISGDGQENSTSYLNMATKLGAQKAFAKPLQRKELLDAIHNLLTLTEA